MIRELALTAVILFGLGEAVACKLAILGGPSGPANCPNGVDFGPHHDCCPAGFAVDPYGKCEADPSAAGPGDPNAETSGVFGAQKRPDGGS